MQFFVDNHLEKIHIRENFIFVYDIYVTIYKTTKIQPQESMKL